MSPTQQSCRSHIWSIPSCLKSSSQRETSQLEPARSIVTPSKATVTPKKAGDQAVKELTSKSTGFVTNHSGLEELQLDLSHLLTRYKTNNFTDVGSFLRIWSLSSLVPVRSALNKQLKSDSDWCPLGRRVKGSRPAGKSFQRQLRVDATYKQSHFGQ